MFSTDPRIKMSVGNSNGFDLFLSSHLLYHWRVQFSEKIKSASLELLWGGCLSHQPARNWFLRLKYHLIYIYPRQSLSTTHPYAVFCMCCFSECLKDCSPPTNPELNLSLMLSSKADESLVTSGSGHSPRYLGNIFDIFFASTNFWSWFLLIAHPNSTSDVSESLVYSTQHYLAWIIAQRCVLINLILLSLLPLPIPSRGSPE